MNAVKRKQLPRLAKILDKYLPLIEGKTEVPYEERLRLKGQYVAQLREELEQMKARRSAFTLVEMLVAVALVVLLMTLFATIFQIATQAMSTQKGLAENDQRVRLVLNKLRNDLNGVKNDTNDPGRPYRTFRNLIPFGPDEQSQFSNFSANDRNGYFYISENNPDDDTDDVLALTVQYPATASDQFFGQASVVLPDSKTGSYGTGGISPGAAYPPVGSTTVPIANSPTAGQAYWPNQPDFDDILGVPNKVGNSPFAEVCYFLRKGTLYRRVLLIRDPNGISPTPQDGTPTDASNVSLNLSTYTNVNRTFWNDFDYSAYFDSLHATGFRFNGAGTQTDSLSFVAAFQNPLNLGNPACRFGFDSSTVLNAAKTAQIPSATFGQPREYLTSGGNPYFIGRFTHGETSDPNFGFPGSITAQANGNPMSNQTAMNYDVPSGHAGPVGGLYSGPRAGEDILMTNVLKFDIKVFDPAASVGPDGHPGVAGFIHPTTLVVDDDDGDGIADNVNERGWPGSDDGDFVDIGHTGLNGFYNAGPNAATGRTAGPQNVPITIQRRFSGNPAMLANSTPYLYPNTLYSNAANGWNRYDTWNPSLDFAGDGMNDSPPFRPYNFGPDGRPGTAGSDLDNDGVKNNIGELGWPGSDDQPVPLSAIQIKITFFDQTSNQIRETTHIQSLLYVP